MRIAFQAEIPLGEQGQQRVVQAAYGPGRVAVIHRTVDGVLVDRIEHRGQRIQ